MANVADGFGALSDETRRTIFERLARRPLAVGELADGLHVSRPAVSQHLKVLLDARLVRVEQEGTRRIYSVDTRGVQAMRRYLDRFWDEALERFKQVAEEEKDA